MFPAAAHWSAVKTARRAIPAALVLAVFAVLAIGPMASTRVAAQSAAVDPVRYSGMQWRGVGPARGGRSIAVGGSDARPNEYWFGATAGGAWKTTDGGTTWPPMTDGKITMSTVGALGVCQANPDVVYIGGGDVRFRGNSGYPDGLRGDDVPVLAQIVSTVDLFEAITMGREYVAPRSADDAITVLRHETSLGWRRPEVMESCIRLVKSGALETFQAAPLEAPLELTGLATDLQHAASSVGAPVRRGVAWVPHHERRSTIARCKSPGAFSCLVACRAWAIGCSRPTAPGAKASPGMCAICLMARLKPWPQATSRA